MEELDPNITAGELMALGERLETQAASVLGRFLFEFSRLEMHCGLCVAWRNEGQDLKRASADAVGMTLHERLDEIEKAVRAKWLCDAEARAAYSIFLARARMAKARRNEWIHGRWGVEPHRQVVVNVVGLPTSPSQRSIPYTVDELGDEVQELQRLQVELNRLRARWPL